MKLTFFSIANKNITDFISKGWEQGVIGMKKGGKRLIAIPSALAYGEKVGNAVIILSLILSTMVLAEYILTGYFGEVTATRSFW